MLGSGPTFQQHLQLVVEGEHGAAARLHHHPAGDAVLEEVDLGDGDLPALVPREHPLAVG